MLFTSPLVPLAIRATIGGSCWSPRKQALQTSAVHAVVVGRDVAVPHAAHVVQRIARVHGDRPPVGLAQGQDRHRGVGRPGRLDEVRAARRRIHLHLVDAAERIGRHGARLEEPAAVEHVLRRLGGGEPELGRAQPVDGAFHAVGDPPGDEALVVVGLLREHEARGDGPPRRWRPNACERPRSTRSTAGCRLPAR